MATLNLVAKGKPQERILAYLQENASDILAGKINSGTPFDKDGKTFINKKTLDGFMKFATDEAKKLAAKGATSTCVEDSVVYGWAIHYFEEDSIEGKLHNEDGTEYVPPKPAKATTLNAGAPVPHSPIKPKPQLSMFDLLDGNAETATQEKPPVQVEIPQPKEQPDNDPSIDEIADRLQQAIDRKPVKADGKIIDADTGEVLCDETAKVSEAAYLLDLLDGKVDIA